MSPYSATVYKTFDKQFITHYNVGINTLYVLITVQYLSLCTVITSPKKTYFKVLQRFT